MLAGSGTGLIKRSGRFQMQKKRRMLSFLQFYKRSIQSVQNTEGLRRRRPAEFCPQTSPPRRASGLSIRQDRRQSVGRRGAGSGSGSGSCVQPAGFRGTGLWSCGGLWEPAALCCTAGWSLCEEDTREYKRGWHSNKYSHWSAGSRLHPWPGSGPERAPSGGRAPLCCPLLLLQGTEHT